MNSYSKIERRLFDDFIRFGYKKDVAEAIAHTFTQYILGYLNEDQAYECITRSGASDEVADAVLESFRAVKQNSKIGVDPHSERPFSRMNG